MPSKCPKMPFLGGYWGYFSIPSIRLKIAQNSPVLGGTSRVIAKGVKSCLELPKNSLKNRWFLPFFGGYGKYANHGGWGVICPYFLNHKNY